MKKTILLFKAALLIMAISGLIGCTRPQVRGSIIAKFHGANPRIGIGSDNDLADGIGYELIANNLKIIERTKLHNIIKEQALGQTGSLEDHELIKAGKILNIDVLIFVNAQNDEFFPDRIASAVVKIVDVQSGEVLGSIAYKNGRGGAPGSQADDDMKDSLYQSANRIVKEIIKGFKK